MYKIDKKDGNLNMKIYIDSNLEHLLASNFTESLFLKCSNAYKILHGFDRNTRVHNSQFRLNNRKREI